VIGPPAATVTAILGVLQWLKILPRMKYASLLIVTLVAGERPMTEHDAALNQPGVELRQSILDEFARLKANKSERDGYDLGLIIRQYIPPDTSYLDAVTILKAGNFDIRPPSSYRYGKEEIFLVGANIVLESSFPSWTTYAYVKLLVDKIEPTPTRVVDPQGNISTTHL